MRLRDTRGQVTGRRARHGAWWLRRMAGVGAGAVLALVVSAGPALAHADLASSSPANDARLDTEPHRIVLVYTENVEIGLSTITVVAPDGRRVSERPLRRAGGQANTLMANLQPDQAHGTYVLDWRTVASDDGHLTAGGLTFSVGAPTRVAPGPAAATGTPQSTNVALELTGWLAFAGFALLAGCAAVRLACLPPGPATGSRAMWPAAAGWLVLLGATLAQLLLHGPYTAGLGPTHLLDRDLLGTTVSTHLGHALMVRIGLLALFAVFGDQAMRRAAAARPRGWSMAAVAVLTVGLAATWGATSHAASGRLATVAVPVATAHVAAMGLWAGGLFTLGVCLLRPPVMTPRGSGPAAVLPSAVLPSTVLPSTVLPPAVLPPAVLPAAVLPPGGAAVTLTSGAPGLMAQTAVATTTETARIQAGEVAALRVAITRFSTLALASVITLVLTGGYLAVREVASLGALTGTSYGRLVLVKAAGLIIIVAVASRSRRYVRRRLGDGIAGLRRTVLVELAGVGLLLAVATMLMNTPPARDAIQSPRPPAAAAQDAVRGWLRPVPGSEPAATAGRGRTGAERDECGPPPALGCRFR
jgi:copper transport protein